MQVKFDAFVKGGFPVQVIGNIYERDRESFLEIEEIKTMRGSDASFLKLSEKDEKALEEYYWTWRDYQIREAQECEAQTRSYFQQFGH